MKKIIKKLVNSIGYDIVKYPPPPPQISIPLLVISVGHACTLKCRDCGVMNYFAPKDTLKYDIKKIINDLKIFINECYIDRIQIQGGEPFLYPDIPKLVSYLLKYNNVSSIDLATNGTIMPKFNLTSLRNDKVAVRISNYPVVGEIKGNQIKKELEDAGIKCYFFSFQRGDNTWTYRGGVNVPEEKNDNIVMERFNKCGYKGCLTLEDGKLGYCSRSIIAEKIQGFKSLSTDYFILKSKRHFKTYFPDYYKNKNFMTACRYCYGSNNEAFEPAIQIENNYGNIDKRTEPAYKVNIN